MKTLTRMKKNFLTCSLAALLLGSAALVSVAGANDDAVVQTTGKLSYVSGGVGSESIDRLNSLAGEFNLKLVFALQSGEYVSGVRVVIADAKGKTLLDTTSEGPWLLTRLPAGNYRIVATLAGKPMNHQTAIAAEKLKTIDFRWASE